MRISILAEGSASIGAGHQVRMGVLAGALAKRGHHVELWARDLLGSTHGWAWQGMPCKTIPAHLAIVDLVAAATANCDILVVDHYGVGVADLARVPKSIHIVLIDDVPGRDVTGASLVVNQNLGVEAKDYPVRALTGPEYALVRDPFCKVTHKPTQEFLVMIGATDDLKLNDHIATTIQGQYPGQVVSVVSANEYKAAAGSAIVARHRLDGEALAQLMSRCRAAVLAASSSVYEAMAVGLPFIAVHTASNQDRVARALDRQQLAPVIRPAEWQLVADLIKRLPRSIPRSVDGKGAERIAKALENLG
jgi:UDP-2,4-diacetamido-2,4,6-trideoxy-beta-L-altropyranose hydrolase